MPPWERGHPARIRVPHERYATSQAFSLEVEEEMEVENYVTQENIEDVEIAIEEMLFLLDGLEQRH